MRYKLIAAFLLGTTAATQVYAEAPAAGGDQPDVAKSESGIAEIIVTAEKRSARLADVPLAITALSGDEIKKSGIVETSDLARIVPSFNVEVSFRGNPVYYIRGIGFNNAVATVTPAVAVYADQVPLPYPIMARGAVLDLQRVEVLKGPQGTLFGQNATGGAVNYIPAKPTDAMEYGTDITYGRFNTIDASAYVGGPISDTLGFRAAGQIQSGDDWQFSTTRNDTRGQKKFINGRLILAWKPSDRVDFELTGQAWHDSSDTQGSQPILIAPQNPAGNPTARAAYLLVPLSPSNPRATDWDPNSPKARDDTFKQIALRGGIDLSDTVRLNSITAYSKLSSYVPVDTDSTFWNVVLSEETVSIKSFSQELRLEGKAGRLEWMLGGNYQHDKTADSIVQTLNGSNNAIAGRVFTAARSIVNNPSINNYAAFASANYELNDALTVRGSIRYTDLSIKSEGCWADPGNGSLAVIFSTLSTTLSHSPQTIAPGGCVTLDAATSAPSGLVHQELKENNLSWRIGLDWKLTPETMLYAGVAKGYKAGGFTALPAVSSSQLAPVTQESVLAYEAGVKSSLFDKRVYVDASAFYYDYKDKQMLGFVSTVLGNLTTLVNIPKSEVFGLELNTDVRVTSHLTAKLTGSYLHTEVLKDPFLPRSPLGASHSYVGESFPNTPKYQVNFDVEQRIPLSDATEGYVGGNVTYRSSASGAFGRTSSALEQATFTLPEYTLLDLRAGLRFDNGSKGIELWGRNITNKLYLYGVGRPNDFITRQVGAPARYGVRLFWHM
jgi:outer membrane receptor protein involved in Fe transport